MGFRVKICGVTNVEDARLVAEAGADYVGVVVEVGYSPRSLRAEQAAAVLAVEGVGRVALLLDPSQDGFRRIVELLQPDAVQLVGEESPDKVARLAEIGGTAIWKSAHLPPAGEGCSHSLEETVRAIQPYKEAGAEIIVLDTIEKGSGVVRYGGTGIRSDWGVARAVAEASPLPIMLAGGLGPGNVSEALRRVRPFGVDMASGVEREVGKKDREKVTAVVKAVREFGVS